MPDKLTHQRPGHKPRPELSMEDDKTIGDGSSSGNGVVIWTLGLIFALFVIVGFVRLAQKYGASQGTYSLQMAARADLDLLLKSEQAFHRRFGFYTTDLASLKIEPKYAFYKFGFIKAGIVSESEQDKVPTLDSSRKDLDFLVAARPELNIGLSDQTRLAEIPFDSLAKFCPNCTAETNKFMALAAANLDADPTLDVWTIDQDGHVQQVVNDIQ